MAYATTATTSTITFVLTLTQDEADTLATVLGNVCGGPTGRPRDVVNISRALDDAGAVFIDSAMKASYYDWDDDGGLEFDGLKFREGH